MCLTTIPLFWRRKWLPRLAMLAMGSLVGLVLADRIVGLVLHSSQRHDLRLPANVRYRHRSTEFDYEFRSNSRGLRGPEIPLARESDEFRIALLGDSFVAGFGVDDESLMTSQLQRRLNPPSSESRRVQVINLGRVGASTVSELAIYESLGRAYRPDLVVLVYFLGNDLREIVNERDREELQAWHPPGMMRRSVYGLVPNLYLELAMWKQDRTTRRRFGPRSEEELLAALDAISRAVDADPDLARQRYFRVPAEVRQSLERGEMNDWQVFQACYDPARLQLAISPDDAFFNRAWPRTEKHLDLLRTVVERDGARLVVVAIPGAVQVDRQAYEFMESLGYQLQIEWLSADGSPIQTSLSRWANAAEVPYLDTTADLRRSAERLYYVQDGHFNAAGQAEAARLIAEFLRLEHLVP